MAHVIDSVMMYIHPPLALIGYVCVVFSLVFLLKQWRTNKKYQGTPIVMYSAWLFTLLGLCTGMLWAQLAWGSYWSWDPKETMTLLLFLTSSISVLLSRKREKISLVLMILSLFFVLINLMITIGNYGLHSYNL